MVDALTLIIGIIAVLVIVALVLFFWGINVYNEFVRLRNYVSNKWHNIDSKLKQRFDEIPNLVNTVKGYMKHEKDVLMEVTNARTAWMKAKSIPEKAAAEGQLAGALKTMFAVSENYPQLKANENFTQLQGRISSLEEEISSLRREYNEAVRELNTKRETFPDLIIANLLKIKLAEMFQASESERKAPKVEF